MYKSKEERLVYKKAELSDELIQRHQRRLPRETMYYIGLDVHKRTISYCVKDGSGKIHAEGTEPRPRGQHDAQRNRKEFVHASSGSAPGELFLS
jgi:hypothetical protein